MSKKVETKKPETKKTEAPKKEAPKEVKKDAPKKEAPKAEVKKTEVKKTDAPKKTESKKTEAPKKTETAPKKTETAPKKVEEKKEKKEEKTVEKKDEKKEPLKPKRKGEKKVAKYIHRYTVDCAIPVKDGIFDLDNFHLFLVDRFKVDGKVKNFGGKVTIFKEHDQVKFVYEVSSKKTYIKYLTKKYLKKQDLRDYLHCVSTGKGSYQLKYFPITQEEDEKKEKAEKK